MSSHRILQALAGGLLITLVSCGGAEVSIESKEGDAERGREAYLERCSQCHGLEGKGDGPAAGFMLPRPRIFADNKDYKFRTTPDGELPTDRDLFNIISRGLPGTAMPPFEVLDEQVRWDLVTYIKSLAEDFEDEELLETSIPLDSLVTPSPPEVSDELIARGAEVYAESKCVQCHGENGRGNGPSWPDLKDTWKDPACRSDTCDKTPILPADLTNSERFRGGRQLYDLYRLMSTGPSGSAMPLFDIPEDNDRWALSAYVLSLGPAAKQERDEVVRAQKFEALPADDSDEAWKDVPAARFETLPNVIEPPRLYWSSVEYITAQAVYTDAEVALRIQWNDRSQSQGDDLSTEYKDRDTTVYTKTNHPDQFAIQFPARMKSPEVRPYFLMGDRKRAVNLWWWQSHTNALTEYNAKGWSSQKAQPERSQTVTGQVSYDDGRYTLVVRRSLTNDDLKNDVQFAAGAFVPIAFNVWNGNRGELGQRRSVTTWYWLHLKPTVPEHVVYVPPITFAVSFGLLLGLIGLVRRAKRSTAERTE